DSTIDGIHHAAVNTIGVVPQITAGKYVVVGIQFKPGYTWTANVDTLASMNSVRFISNKQNPGNNPPTTFGFPTITKNDFNISYIVPQDVRYNVGGGWNGRFVPSYAYMGSVPTYSYEHHWLQYKVNTLLVGYDE